MKLFFNPQSKMSLFLAKVIDLFWLNVLFIVTSLPIVTIGPSLLALNTVAMKLAMNEDSGMIVTHYLSAFKENIKRGLQLTGVLFICSGLVLTSSYCLSYLQNSSVFIGAVSLVVLLAIMSILFLFLFPYNARYEDGLIHSMKTSLQIAALNWQRTLLVVGCIGMYGLFLTWNTFCFALGTLLFLLVGFSTVAFFVCKQLFPIFIQYEKGAAI
ncbi:hypothetical protein IGI37_003020 [Enterococcus sp. AZ194]|uniref:YesL family protein n=1 Tax=Enterococcus sp. AZ194 TaxID=2774629 RepID=UPI003F22290D